MNKLNNKKLEEVCFFAEKYFGFDNEDIAFLRRLVDKLTIIVKAKFLKAKEDDDVSLLSLSKEDLEYLCLFEKNYLTFNKCLTINLIRGRALIDEFGFIKATNDDSLLGKNILEIENDREEVKMMFLNNIMISKIYQAVLEKIQENKKEADLYLLGNSFIINYESELRRKIQDFNLKSDMQIRQRSYR